MRMCVHARVRERESVRVCVCVRTRAGAWFAVMAEVQKMPCSSSMDTSEIYTSILKKSLDCCW